MIVLAFNSSDKWRYHCGWWM